MVGRSHRMIFRYHERYGQWHVPNQRAYVPHERGYFIIRTNRDGMRASRNYAYDQVERGCRIVLFGDSFTAGEGVHNEERFSDLLEQFLDVEVLNFGLDGSGIDQQLLIYEDLGSRFKADVVLLCPSVENIRRVALPYWGVRDRMTWRTVFVAKPYFVLEGGALRAEHLPVPRRRLSVEDAPEYLRRLTGLQPGTLTIRRVLGRLLGPLRPLALRLSRYQAFPQYDAPDTPEWLLVKALLERVVASAGSRIVVLAPLPIFYYIEGFSPAIYRARFHEFVQAHPQVHFIDLLPFFLAASRRDRRRCRYGQDPHYTPLAHAVVARALSSELARLGLVRRRAEAARVD